MQAPPFRYVEIMWMVTVVLSVPAVRLYWRGGFEGEKSSQSQLPLCIKLKFIKLFVLARL